MIRALRINAYVLSLIALVEKNCKQDSSSKKAIGFLHQKKCRHAYVLSLTTVVKKAQRAAAAKNNMVSPLAVVDGKC